MGASSDASSSECLRCWMQEFVLRVKDFSNLDQIYWRYLACLVQQSLYSVWHTYHAPKKCLGY